jgi:hypothetical protein
MSPNVFLLLSSVLSPSALAAGTSVSSLGEGDLVISEMMVNPAAVRAKNGEWLEIYNTTAASVDLQGLIVSGRGSFTIEQSITVPAGGYAVLAVNGSSGSNGGLPVVDYVYSYDDMELNNRTGIVTIGNGAGTIDSVSYSIEAGFPAPWGATLNLDPGYVDTISNDESHRWCGATTEYGIGDQGTPGSVNDSCPTPLIDLSVGQLIVSEIMPAPAGVQERYGEWFEVTNPNNFIVDFYGLIVSSAGGEAITLSTHLFVAPGAQVLFAASGSSGLNGGLNGIDVVYGLELTLDNTDTLELSYQGTVFDTVSWDESYPLFTGAALNLNVSFLDADSNDDSGYWCTPSSAYSGANFGTPGRINDVCLEDADGDGVAAGTDCDDGNPAVNPFATEVCDGIDNDCDVAVDEAVTTTFYADSDGDGYGLTGTDVEVCEAPEAHALVDGDCNDDDATLNPGVEEICDDLDNDCDGSVDEFVKPRYFVDVDGDGYGDAATSGNFCAQPAGWVSDSSDCDDGEPLTFPGNTEICDDLDNDCDLEVDEFVKPRYFADGDGDGYGNSADGISSCTPISDRVLDHGDCDDADDTIYPTAEEVCDTLDNDCDGEIDENTVNVFFVDADGDGFGNPFSMTEACTVPDGHVDSSSDCDDADGAIYPDAVETCDGLDNDCDGLVDEDELVWYADADGDGQGDPASAIGSCEQPTGYVLIAGDCDDTNPYVGVDGIEACDGIDNDCDGEVDENVSTTWYADADGDSYGDASVTEAACDEPDGFTDNSDDCNDTDAGISPLAEEVCDDLDNNCDGSVDEELVGEYYADGDGDGYGVGEAIAGCSALEGYAESAGDCDDSEPETYPSALELCDGIDNDCNGVSDTDAVASTYALTFDQDRMLKYVRTETGEVTIQSGPYDDVGEAHNAIAGSPIAGRLFLHNNAESQIYELDPDNGEATPVFAHSVPNVCGIGLTDEENLYALSTNDDSLYFFNLATQTSTRIGALGTEVGHCGLVYSNRNQTLYGISVDGANNSWVLRIDTDTGEATRLTQLSPGQSWNTAGITYDELTDTIYVVSAPGIFEVDMDPERSGGSNVTLITEDIENDNLSFFATSRNASRYYTDADGDGFGDPATYVDSCEWPSGMVTNAADCDDADELINPAVDDICDDIDNDCDGRIDEDADFVVYYEDLDGDGYGNPDTAIDACSQPIGHCTGAGDPDDEDPETTPEVCDGIDNDGNGQIDEGFEVSTWYADTDGDGFGDPDGMITSCEQPASTVDNADDCDDSTSLVFPGAADSCDGLDNDCDGLVDEDAAVSTWYADADGDGFGDVTVMVESCSQPEGFVADQTDCDDELSESNPGAAEVCDGIDNDCNNEIDEDLLSYYYADVDADGYGDPADSIASCEAVEGYVSDDSDCDDSLSSVNPGMEEACDDLDNDCDDEIDEDALLTWYADLDRDTHGDASFIAESCEPVSVFDAEEGDDCDDRDAEIYPGAEEVCDEIDNDCDTAIDEGLTTTWYEDDDGDGYGDASDPLESCGELPGYSPTSDDCDDRNDAIHPDAEEICDTIDNDCDAEIDEGVLQTWYTDTDRDGYGSSDISVESCDQPDGYVDNSEDCNDCDAAAWEDGTEACALTDMECGAGEEEPDEEVDGELQVIEVCSDESVMVLDESGAIAQAAEAVSWIHPSWTADISGATWVWESAMVEDPTVTETVRFFQPVDLPENAELQRATLAIAADNAYAFSMNGAALTETLDQRAFDAAEEWDITADMTDGANDFIVDVTNIGSSSTSPFSNPAGLMYCITVEYLGEAAEEPEEEIEDTGDVAEDTGEWADTGDVVEDTGDVVEDTGGEDTGGEDTGDFDENPWYYADADGDGYGDPDFIVESPIPLPGFVSNGDDCDDEDASVHTATEEICDGLDNDCDGEIDEGFTVRAWYADVDGDGFGDPDDVVDACEAPDDTTDNPSDPDDTDDTVTPEVCDGIDNDGDGEVDEALLELSFDDETVSSDILILTGDAKQDEDGELLSLVTAEQHQSGSAMVAFPMPSDAWRVSFQMWMGGGTGADGMGLIIIDPAESELLGSQGGGLGVRGLNGYSIEFDTHQNDSWRDPNENHVALVANKVFSHIAINDTIPEMEDVGWIDVEIIAADDTITVMMDGVEVLSAPLPDDLPDNVMLGLAAATGVKTNDHLVDDLTIGCPVPAEEEEEVPCDTAIFYEDLDGDGHGNPDAAIEACEQPSGTVESADDCDDTDASVSPSAQDDSCDGLDNNCSGDIDEDASLGTWHIDADGDGHGDAAAMILSCEQPASTVESADDCDDRDAEVSPSAEDVCDSLDNNCNGDIDEDAPLSTWHADTDGDGHGDPASAIEACAQPMGTVEDSEDCDDTDAAVNPAAEDVCDGLDNNCNGDIDEDAAVATWNVDADGDGYGDREDVIEACAQPEGTVDNGEDCDDNDGLVSPAGAEVCDGVDNNCDALIDEGLLSYAYADVDGDGYGDAADAVEGCEPVDGYVTDDTDCDDSLSSVNPGTEEVCDELDNNCNDEIDEGVTIELWVDADGDGHGDAGMVAEVCAMTEGLVDTDDDCDDNDAAVSPSAEEVCDERDNDCDGDIDEDDASNTTTYYADADNDKYGDAGSTRDTCDRPIGYRTNSLDCDDDDDGINPGAAEVCDDIDNDCNSLIDDSPTDGTTYYADTDDDGYGDSGNTLEACTRPSGYRTNSLDRDDTDDNCIFGANADQADSDANGIGDTCDIDADEEIACCNSADYNCSGLAQAGTASLQSSMGSVLSDQTVFANTYVSAGAGSTGDETVYGNVLANSYVTMGAGSTVTGNIQTGTNLTTGASATIDGSTLAVGASTLGAYSAIYTDVRSGTAVTLGANSQVVGDLEYGTVVTYGAGAASGADAKNTTVPVIVDEHQGVLDAQSALDAMTGGTAIAPGNIATDTTFTAGVYDVDGLLTVTAGVTITLDAEDEDSEFIFNIGSYLGFGAGVNVVVINGTDNTRVIWNATGGYISIGANANIVGTILARDYVSAGADASLTGVGDYCGSVYSGTSYVSIGAGATVGDHE